MTPQPPPGQGPAVPPAGGYPPPGGFPPPGFPRGPMGPMGPMPPMMMMPPPAPRGGGLAKALLVTLATTLFGVSILLNIYLLVAVSMTSGGGQASDFKAIETPIPSQPAGNSADKIAVVRLSGVITDASKRPFVLLLEHLRRDNDLKALVLEIDSPGGGVTPSDEIYDAVMRLKKEKNIPVVVSMGSLAASGGYYVAMTGDHLWAQETTLTGSIGVLFQRYDLSEFADKYGIKDGTIVSDGATYKESGSMMKPMNEDELAYFKSLLNDARDVFKKRIQAGRPMLKPAELDAVANGKIYSAKQALNLKLVDHIGYLDDAIADAAKLAGLTKPNVVRVERELTFAEKLFGADASSAIGGAKSQVSANGVNVTVDRDLVDTFTRPRMMYLWQGN